MTSKPSMLSGEHRRHLRLNRGDSLRRVAMLSEGAISHVHISHLEKGLASWDELSFHRIRGLARAFGITPAKLIETIEGRRIDAFEDAKLYRLPMVVEGAGLPRWGGDNEGTIVVALPDIDVRDDSQIFAIIMKDDAMAPYAYKGNRVVFDYEGHPNVGDVVALEYPGQGLNVRRFRGFSKAGRYLISEDATGAVCEVEKASASGEPRCSWCGSVPRKKGRDGRGSIYQREDNGLWVASVVLGRGAGGRLKRKSVSSRSYEECLRKLQKLEQEIEAGKYAGSELRFVDRCEDWLSEMKHQVKGRTLKVYRDELAHACRTLGSKPLQEVTAANIRAMQRQLAEQVGAPTAKKVRDRVSAVLEAAFRDEEVARNVAKHVKAVKQTKYPVLIWSSEEIDLFLNHHRNHRLYSLFFFYLATGARRSEALAMKWDKVDFRSREVHIHETITVTEKGSDYGLPKTLAGYRTVPGGAELFEVYASTESARRPRRPRTAAGRSTI